MMYISIMEAVSRNGAGSWAEPGTNAESFINYSQHPPLAAGIEDDSDHWHCIIGVN